MTERLTSDPIDAKQLQKDVANALNTIAEGGVAIIPMNVGYAIIAATEAGMKRIFTAKNRSYDKPSGNFGSWQLSHALHVMEEDKHHMIKTLVEEVKLPFSVVAPFDASHPLLTSADPFVIKSSTLVGTMDMVINCGPFHDELARQSLERNLAVFGSSANTSLTGTKYRLADVDKPVRDAADLCLDYGRALYANEFGHSSSIIDFRDFSVVRVGIEFPKLAEAFKTHFDIGLKVEAA